MKYYKILKHIDCYLDGVVAADDEDDAQAKIDEEHEDVTQNITLGTNQEDVEFEEVTKEQYEELVKYCKSH